MKKLISIILVMVMVLSTAVIASAAKTYYYGDVNADGKVTAVDAVLVLQSAAEIKTLTKSQAKRADCNKDGKVTAVDARKILQVVAELIPLEQMPTGVTPNIDGNGGNNGNDNVSWDDVVGKK